MSPIRDDDAPIRNETLSVTFFCANYSPSVGGAQTHVQRVAEGLAQRHGHRVEVITTNTLLPPGGPNPGMIQRRIETIGGVSVRRVPVARRLHSAIRFVIPFSRRLEDARRAVAFGPLGLRLLVESRRAARRSDVVVGVMAPYLTLLGADVGTRGTRAAYVAMPLIHLSGDPIPPWARRSLARAVGVTASTTVERDWLRGLGIDAGRLAVLPPGCDPERYPDLTPAEARAALGLPERLTVGYVGRLAVHKGVDTLLEAAPQLWKGHPDLTVLVAGARTGWGELDSRLSALDAVSEGRVVVREGFRDEERALLLAACDVVAFPSREESFGMVTIEAWCARRAVVAGDIDAVRSLIRAGEDGELVPVGDAAALAEAIGPLLDDPERRAAMGRRGRARAEHEFAWDTIVDGWDRFLRETVARAHRVVR